MIKRLLVDGANMAHRMRHTHKGLTDKDGNATGVLYGMLISLQYLWDIFDPDVVCVAWEDATGAKSWRKKVYPEYKQQRHKKFLTMSQEELDSYEFFVGTEMPEVFYALSQIGVVSFAVPKLEGDDIIAILSMDKARDDIIISTDKDFIQCTSKTTRVYNPITEVMYFLDDAGLQRNVDGGDKPADWLPSSTTLYLLFRVLCGDTSDNVPGVRGVGPARAFEFIQACRGECPVLPSCSRTLDLWTRHANKSGLCLLSPSIGRTARLIQDALQHGVIQRAEKLMTLRGLGYIQNVGADAITKVRRNYKAHLQLSTNGTWRKQIEYGSYPGTASAFFAKKDFYIGTNYSEWRSFCAKTAMRYQRLDNALRREK